MVLLSANYEEKSLKSYVTYDKMNKSFDTIPKMNSDIALIISYINIGFDSETMTANQVWGFSPDECWIKKKMQSPTNFRNGTLRLKTELEPGSWRLDRDSQWKSYINPQTGWLCMGDSELNPNDTPITFLENAIAVLNKKDELKALWVHL